MSRSLNRLAQRFPQDTPSAQLHFVAHDIREPLPTAPEFDYIVHCASFFDPVSYARYPVETLLTIVDGTKQVMDYCRRHPRCRVVYLSSYLVYGDTLSGSYTEEQYGLLDFTLLRSAYPEGKRAAENLVRAYVDEYGADACIARLSCVYGPTMEPNDSKAHAQFIRNALRGEDIVMKSDGLQQRVYTYMMDVVTGLLCVLFRGGRGEIYNVCHSEAVATIRRVAEIAAAWAGTKVVAGESSSEEKKGSSKPQDCVPDNGKLKGLGWQGAYTVNEGLAETLDTLKSWNA